MKPYWASTLALLVAFGSARAEPVDRIAAVVNDEVVTLSELYDVGRDTIEKRAMETGSLKERRVAELEVLEQKMRSILIRQELERLQIYVTDQQLFGHLNLIVANNADLQNQDELRTAVENSGMIWEEYLNQIKEGLRIDTFRQIIIRPRIVESEDTLLDAYNRLLNDPNRAQMVDLGALFIGFQGFTDAAKKKAMDVAKAAKKRHDDGESFAAIAAELDMGPYGRDGGTMGTFREGEIMTELDGPAFSVPVGEVSQPIASSRGVFLIEVRKRYLEPIPPYEEIKQDLSLQVYNMQYMREEDAWYQIQRRKSSVEVKLEAPDTL